MIDPAIRRLYFDFYKEIFKHSRLDRKTKELISIAASLASRCQGCLDGHIKRALKEGATREEIGETIAITIGVSGASIVDQTDQAAARLSIRMF